MTHTRTLIAGGLLIVANLGAASIAHAQPPRGTSWPPPSDYSPTPPQQQQFPLREMRRMPPVDPAPHDQPLWRMADSRTAASNSENNFENPPLLPPDLQINRLPMPTAVEPVDREPTVRGPVVNEPAFSNPAVAPPAGEFRRHPESSNAYPAPGEPLAEALAGPPPPETVIPPEFTPWWQTAALQPLRQSPDSLQLDVNSLLIDTLRYSARVRAISDHAIIAETAITRAGAEFDIHGFMESRFVRTSVPTGSVLDAGFDVPRLRESDWFNSVGVRKKNNLGGRFEMSQQYGARDSNSNFFFPENQANARLTLSYNQPLLHGAGHAYNTSLIVLAELDTRIAADRTSAELQDHLLEVTQALWELYLQRSVLLQKQRNLSRAQTILTRLEKRRDLDSLDSQIARARAAVAMRRTELIRAGAAIQNAEARLRALVNSPYMLTNRQAELVPIQAPLRNYVPVTMQDAVLTALENRPEIDAASQEIEAARVRLKVAKNELMPVLDLVLETYVSGIRGDYDISNAYVDQFAIGEPSYTAGLLFDVPLFRRAAKANFTRREAELRKLSSQFQATLELLNAEVEVAVREVETSYRELQARFQAMMAADADAEYLRRRWEMLPGDDRAASFLLEDLLDAQDRLAFAEFTFAQSQVAYTISLTNLNRATGTLLQHEQIELLRACEEGLPSIVFEKSGPPYEGSLYEEVQPPPLIFD